MAQSKLIAGFIGPLLMAMGVAMLINRHLFPEMIGQLAHNYALIFLSGVLSLLAGIAIVRVHNVWSAGWPVIITVVGWLGIVGGVARMWFPQLAAPVAETFAANSTTLLIAGLVVLALGAFLSFKAYLSDT
jgi:hypothetical protein